LAEEIINKSPHEDIEIKFTNIEWSYKKEIVDVL
jgi:type VI protein secretion system component Hcp